MGKERDNNRERFRDALCPMGVVLRGSALHSRTDYMAFSDSDHGLALKALVNGDSAAQGGAFAAAIIHYKDAIRLRPDYAEAYYKVGCALAEIEDFDGSIRSFDEYIRLQPQDPNGYLCRGRVFCDRGNMAGPSASTAGRSRQARLRPRVLTFAGARTTRRRR